MMIKNLNEGPLCTMWTRLISPAYETILSIVFVEVWVGVDCFHWEFIESRLSVTFSRGSLNSKNLLLLCLWFPTFHDLQLLFVHESFNLLLTLWAFKHFRDFVSLESYHLLQALHTWFMLSLDVSFIKFRNHLVKFWSEYTGHLRRIPASKPI